MDLFRAGVIGITDLVSLGVQEPDYLDKRRVVVQRNAITRIRPAMEAGWSAEFVLSVLLPEYIAPSMLHSVLSSAGKLVGVGDFRPSYGRYQIDSFEVLAG